MAYSKSTYPGDGSTTEFSVEFPYLETEHVTVTVDGIATDFTWANASTVTIDPAPAVDAVVLISRDSSRAQRITSFADQQMLGMDALNYDALQNFYVAQEAFDAASVSSVGGGDMLGANNLSDVHSASAARSFLGALPVTDPEIDGHLTLDSAPTLSLHAVTKAYVDAAIAAIPAGTGEVNTGSNLGGGVPIFKAKSGVDFEHYTLVAGAGATVTPVGDTVVIAATGAGGGEVNAGANLNVTGLPLYTTKSGVNLLFKGVGAADTSIDTAASTAQDVLLKVNRAVAYAWTEAHVFSKAALSNAPSVKIESLGNGAMPSSGATLNTGYVGAGDIKMTSNAATAGNANNVSGGIHALYVQHSVAGASPGTNTRLFGGVRSQVDGNATGVATEYTAFYGNAQNNNSGVANYAWSFFCDVVHANSNVNSKTFGYAAEVVRQNANGGVYAYMAQVMNSSTSAPTAAFMVAKQDATAGKKFTTGFSIGDAVNFAEVDIGLDMAYATINATAIRIPSLNHIVMSGVDANNRSMVWDSSDQSMQFQYAGSYRFSIPLKSNANHTHAFDIKTGAGTSGGKGFVETSVTDGAATSRNPQGYVRIKIDGIFKRLAYYSDT